MSTGVFDRCIQPSGKTYDDRTSAQARTSRLALFKLLDEATTTDRLVAALEATDPRNFHDGRVRERFESRYVALTREQEVSRPPAAPTWETRIKTARTYPELVALWEEAALRGEWTDDLTALARARSAQVSSGPCGCPRQADLWLCKGRPKLQHDPDGRRCELGQLWRTTGTDNADRAAS